MGSRKTPRLGRGLPGRTTRPTPQPVFSATFTFFSVRIDLQEPRCCLGAIPGVPFHVSGNRQTLSHLVGPGNLSLFLPLPESHSASVTRFVPQSHTQGSPLTVGRDCWDGRPILCLSRTERSLGQRGRLSVSR